jgi:hypothetical protein
LNALAGSDDQVPLLEKFPALLQSKTYKPGSTQSGPESSILDKSTGGEGKGSTSVAMKATWC